MKLVSIVISIYNEEENINIFYKELEEKLLSLEGKINYEIIFVNDGSIDNSLQLIKQIQQQDSTRVKIVNFTKNFGHEIAMTAGVHLAKGDAVLFMDGDGQNPASVAIKLIDEWLKGYDIVLSKRKNYKETLIKAILSKLFYKILNLLSDVEFNPNYPDFRIISRKYIDRIRSVTETERMFRFILTWIGITNYKIVEFEVPERLKGKSSYNLLRYFNLGLNGILQFSIKPLRIFTIFAIIACIFSLSYAGFVFIDHLMNDYTANGFATIIITMIVLFSIQILIMALIGEYVGRIHIETKKRPLYFADIIEKDAKDKKQ